MLLFFKYWKSAGSKDKRSQHRLWRFFPKDKTTRVFAAMKMCADFASLICVVVGWLWGLGYRQTGVEGLMLVGDVNSTGYILALPGRGASGLMDESMFINAAVIAVVGFLETMAVGGKFAAQYRYTYEPNQELNALGLANAASSLFAGYPVTGSFTRTAVNAQ